MSQAPVAGTDPAAFTRRLLDYGAAATGIERQSFSLPRFRLDLGTDSDGYAAIARRALVDSPAYATPEQRPLQVTLADRQRHPELPDFPVPTGDEAQLEIAQFLAGRYDGAYDNLYRSWQFIDLAAGTGIEALASPRHHAPWVESFPLRNFLHWAYQSIGWRIIHGGTLGVNGQGIMLAGAGGAGKSGTTLSGIMGGLESVGDDYVAVDLSDGRVTAYPVMKLMKQDGKGLARLGLDPVHVDANGPNWQNKYEFDFERLGKGRRAKSLELKAIVMPRIAHQPRSTFTRAASRLAMLAFAPSNLQQLPDGWRNGMVFSAELIRRLPAYYLDLSSDPAEIAGAIGNFIERGAP